MNALTSATQYFCRLFQNGKTELAKNGHDGLRGAIDQHLRGDASGKQDLAMLGGILDLSELEVSDVMVHRTKITMFDVATSQNDVIAAILKSGHSRIPIWKDNPDNIIGILHAKDIFAALLAEGGEAGNIDIEATLKPPWFVPDTRRVSDQLAAFLRRKTHFAIVVDEYGEMMGLVTLEDVLEEIVGEIADEHDTESILIRRRKDGSIVADGATSIRDLNRSLDWHLPDDEATTLAGLIIHEARMIPNVGQVFTFHGFRFEVLRKRRHQVTSIRVTPVAVA